MTLEANLVHPALEAAANGFAPDLLLLAGEACALYCFRGIGKDLPQTGQADGAAWHGLSWQTDSGHHGIAALASSNLGDLEVWGEGLDRPLPIGRPGRVSTDAQALVRFLTETGAPVDRVMALLETGFASGPEAPGTNRFMTTLLRETSETDGFVELSVRPECGGVFLQGWSHVALRGPLKLLGEATGLTGLAAGFARGDILAPASGICLFIKDWDGRIEGHSALFVEADGRPLRLEVLPGAAYPVEKAAATEHVRAILPKLDGDPQTLAEFARICRPRFAGENTLATHTGATTAAIDRVLNTPSGGLFVTGWLLDPLAQVERVILKSTAGFYAPLHQDWHRTERPDLNEAFAEDPRFAGLLDRREALHGFVCTVRAEPETLEGGQLYLELVLADQSCLFLPCDPTPCAGRGAAHPVIAALAPHDPALSTLISRHAAPFLETVPIRRRRSAQVALQPLGGGMGQKDLCALMPVSDVAHLQPVLASLAGTPEAEAMDLILIVGREGSAGLADELDHGFRFYGLTGALLLVADHETLAARLDAAAAATDARDLLLWQPSVLPKAPGWLSALRGAASQCGAQAVVSPLLVYEDGSVFFGGSQDGPAEDSISCAFLGFERRRIATGAPRPAKAVPAEIALINRDALTKAGGFAGRLWGDRYIGHDLSLRLREHGASPWCIPQVEFWMLDTAEAEAPGARGMIDRIDAALLARQQPSRTGAVA